MILLSFETRTLGVHKHWTISNISLEVVVLGLTSLFQRSVMMKFRGCLLETADQRRER